LVIGLQRSVLDELKKQIDITNQNLKAAEAAFQQAEWIVAQARAGYFSSATSMPVHSARAAAAPAVGTTPVGGGVAGGRITNFFSTSTTASWTPDLWGFAAPSSKGFKDDRERYRQCDQEDL